jgi:predicted amidohydrolase
VAQTRPITGDIQGNIKSHQQFIEMAAAHHAAVIIFPELSLTGYEPTWAEELAMNAGDGRFHPFQHMANARQLTIGVGAPIIQGAGVCIGMLLFQPGQPRQLYAKQYLHPDEEPYFVSGQGTGGFIGGGNRLALAICYELSVPAHAANAHQNGAEIYVASVAKYAHGVDTAVPRLAQIANQYGMTVLMANSVGLADGDECAGSSAAWNDKGELVGQLDDASEGVLIFDTDTQEVIITRLALPED